jgi:hypothetical protein
MNARQIVREILVVAVLAGVIFSPAAVFAQAPQGMPDLVGMLKGTPGVTGVEVARTGSGKQVIFAWFENKQAALTWFYSDAHQGLMKGLAPGAASTRAPLGEVADDSGPIMVIASLTYSDAPRVPGVALPLSQIAIELYAPLPGGFAAGGRFAPDAVKVRGLLTAPSAPVNR